MGFVTLPCRRSFKKLWGDGEETRLVVEASIGVLGFELRGNSGKPHGPKRPFIPCLSPKSKPKC